MPMAVIKVLEFRLNKKCQVDLLGAIECEIAEELKAAKKRWKSAKCKRNERGEIEILGDIRPGIVALVTKH